jgi:apolipoprotein N-acyltransferase
MAQMRALETQRYLVRGTSNGISAIINERGAIQAQTEQFVATVLRGEVESRTGSTPFMQAGSTPIIVLSLIALLYARRRNPTSAN